MAKRFKPPCRSIITLTPDELSLLRMSPYDHPVIVRGRVRGIAKNLIDRNLLERDPSATLLVVRRTLMGEEQARPLSRRDVETTTQYIAVLQSRGKHDAAYSYEHCLWHRILVESTLGFVNNAILRAAIRHV